MLQDEFGKCFGKWISFQKKTKKISWFIESQGTEVALILIREVFSTNLEMNDNHQMEITDYRMLTSSAYY